MKNNITEHDTTRDCMFFFWNNDLHRHFSRHTLLFVCHRNWQKGGIFCSTKLKLHVTFVSNAPFSSNFDPKWNFCDVNVIKMIADSLPSDERLMASTFSKRTRTRRRESARTRHSTTCFVFKKVKMPGIIPDHLENFKVSWKCACVCVWANPTFSKLSESIFLNSVPTNWSWLQCIIGFYRRFGTETAHKVAQEISYIALDVPLQPCTKKVYASCVRPIAALMTNKLQTSVQLKFTRNNHKNNNGPDQARITGSRIGSLVQQALISPNHWESDWLSCPTKPKLLRTKQE